MNVWSMMGLSKGLRKGAWTAEEDCLLRQCVDKYGEGKWHQVPLRAGLNRCRKSCRLRWLNYLKPSIKRGKLSSDEVDLLLRLHKLLGNRWSLIAGRLPGRTANDVKNFWNTHLSKKHESFSKTKMKKKIISFIPPPTKEVHRTEVLKPRPRSFAIDNGLPKVDATPPCFGLNNNKVCENSITCGNDESAYSLTDEDNMWLENFLLEESQEQNAQMFDDIEQLWSLFDGKTVEPN